MIRASLFSTIHPIFPLLQSQYLAVRRKPVRELIPSPLQHHHFLLVWVNDTVLTNRVDSVNKSNILSHAKDLLYSLERQRPKGRSIMFLAHSLGGLIVKEVLCRVQHAGEAELNNVLKSTEAVVFLGTFHRGSPGFARLGDLAGRIVSTDTNETLIRSLGLDSPKLGLSRKSFLQQGRTCSFRVKTFQESLSLLESTAVDSFYLHALDTQQLKALWYRNLMS